jgi:hypothetical protein
MRQTNNIKSVLLLLITFTMSDSYSQTLKQMMADNESLTNAYWNFVKTEYTWFDGSRGKLRSDHYRDGMWDTDNLKKALSIFESVDLKRVKSALEQFEQKYRSGDAFMETFNSGVERDAKNLAAQTKERFKQIKIESDFKNEHQIATCHYNKYKDKVGAYFTFKKSLSVDLYNHALTFEERMTENNRQIIMEEMTKLLDCALWLDRDNAEASRKLIQLNGSGPR